MRKVGSASRASAAGSLAAERASTRPTAAEPRVKGSDSASISSRGCRVARPSERLMTAKMQRSATTVVTRTAMSAASQSHAPTEGPDRNANIGRGDAAAERVLRDVEGQLDARAAAGRAAAWRRRRRPARDQVLRRGQDQAGAEDEVTDGEGVRLPLPLDVDDQGLGDGEGGGPEATRAGPRPWRRPGSVRTTRTNRVAAISRDGRPMSSDDPLGGASRRGAVAQGRRGADGRRRLAVGRRGRRVVPCGCCSFRSPPRELRSGAHVVQDRCRQRP